MESAEATAMVKGKEIGEGHNEKKSNAMDIYAVGSIALKKVHMPWKKTLTDRTKLRKLLHSGPEQEASIQTTN